MVLSRHVILIFALGLLGWRSQLYPEDWQPSVPDAAGRFLHDFSYAGYHAGEVPLPETRPEPVVDVTESPYGADPTGTVDATDVIQRALYDVGEGGGGTVFLPAGTYAIHVDEGRPYALHIGHSGVVLAGAGPGQTFVHATSTNIRMKMVVAVRPRADHSDNWYWAAEDPRPVTTDLLLPTTEIPVTDSTGYDVDDWIVLRSTATAEFIEEHGMTGAWSPEEALGPLLYRRITAIDRATHTLTIDVPTRYPMRRRDDVRINRTRPHIEEVGIEDLSFGNTRHPGSGWDTDDYTKEGTGAYDVHGSFFFMINHVVNGWVRRVHSYAPAGNGDVHVLSNGLRTDHSRFITVTETDFRYPQYRGAGGNGYLYVLSGNECLIQDAVAVGARHNYDFSFMQTSGNVIHRSVARSGKLPMDFHQRLSPANLVDTVTLDGDSVEAIYRDCCTHGQSTSQSVIWNVRGDRLPAGRWPWETYIVESQQYGHGYVIGTRGAYRDVKISSAAYGTAPVDYSEGIGMGETLEPHSLYADQLARRMGWAPNRPPLVDVGSDRSMEVGQSIVLEATVTDDGLPEPPGRVSLRWSTATRDAVSFDPDDDASTTVTARLPGRHLIVLEASDGEEATYARLTLDVRAPDTDGDIAVPAGDGSPPGDPTGPLTPTGGDDDRARDSFVSSGCAQSPGGPHTLPVEGLILIALGSRRRRSRKAAARAEAGGSGSARREAPIR